MSAAPPGPLTVEEFLAALGERGITVVVEDDTLRCRGPRGALDPDVLGAISARKPDLLDHLRRPSFAEERLWLQHRLHPEGTAYNLPTDLELRGPLGVPALRDAFAGVRRRHDVLRTRYRTRRGRPTTVLDPPGPARLPLVDLSGLPSAERSAVAARVAADMAGRAFDLAAGPVMRTALVRSAPELHRLLITRHHVASDGWSMGVLLGELSVGYRAAVHGEPTGLARSAVQYREHAARQRLRAGTAANTARLDRWVRRLDGAQVGLDLLRTARGADPDRPAAVLRAEVDPWIVAALHDAVARARVTPFTALLGALGRTLAEMSGQRDLVIGCPAAGRDDHDLDGLLGCFSTALPMRLDLSGAPTRQEMLDRVHRVVQSALDDADLPLELLIDALGARWALADHPLFEVSLAFQNVPPVRRVDLAGIDAGLLPPEPVAPKFPLTVDVTEDGGRWVLGVEYDPARLPPAIAGRLLDRLVEELRMLALGTEDQDPGRVQAPDGIPGRPEPLVMAAAVDAGDGVALVQCGRHVTYAALVGRGARLAAALRAHGAGPETVVEIVLPRGIELVVALLAVAMAGAAARPGDPQVVVPDPARAPVYVVAATTGGDEAAGVPGIAVGTHPGHVEPSTSGPVGRVDTVFHIVAPDAPTGAGSNHPAAADHAALLTAESVWGLLNAWWHAVPALARPQVWGGSSPPDSPDLVHQVWGALTTGGRLALPAPDVEPGTRPDREHTLRERVSVLRQPPTALARPALPPVAAGRGPAVLIASGEPGRIDRLRADAGFVVVCAVQAAVTDMAWRHPPAGSSGSDGHVGGVRALPGLSLAVVEPGRPAVTAAAGELAAGGVGLPRGFGGRPSVTASRLRPDPRSQYPGCRLMGTGLLVRSAGPGRLELLGPVDSPRVGGMRVDPAAVEAAMREHPAVLDSAVLMRATDRSPVLTGYVVARDGPDGRPEPVDPDRLRHFLADRLPRRSVPAVVLTVPVLPTTRAGTLDAGVLPAPPRPAARRRPGTPTERVVAAILAELWRLPDTVGLDDDLLDLGADSLLVTQLQARLVETFRIVVPARRIHGSLDVGSLARAVDEFCARAEDDAVRRALAEVEAEGSP